MYSPTNRLEPREFGSIQIAATYYPSLKSKTRKKNKNKRKTNRLLAYRSCIYMNLGHKSTALDM